MQTPLPLLAPALCALWCCGPAEPPAAPPAPEPVPVARDLDREGWAEGLPGLYGRVSPAGEAADLDAIGYAAGYVPPPAEAGVVRHDPERSAPGYTLICSGHAPEALLIDAEGAVVHRWGLEYADVPGAPPVADPQQAATWRAAHVLPDGGLLAIFDGHALVRLRRDSTLVWAYTGRAHHDLALTPDGDVLVLARRARLVPWIHPSEPVVEDLVVRLGLADGRVRSETGVLESFERSAHRALVEGAEAEAGDVLHTNALELLDGRLAPVLPAFRRGNVLISMRHVHALAVIDLDRGRVVWSKTGVWRLQHDPSVLDGGRILLFDNAGYGFSSQVIEIDPRTGAVGWAWRGDPPESFFTLFCGSAQRLAGGNTLIAESCRGRAFEVTREGEVVWEYVNPRRAGERGEWIAAVFEAHRLPPEAVDPWLRR